MTWPRTGNREVSIQVFVEGVTVPILFVVELSEVSESTVRKRGVVGTVLSGPISLRLFNPSQFYSRTKKCSVSWQRQQKGNAVESGNEVS